MTLRRYLARRLADEDELTGSRTTFAHFVRSFPASVAMFDRQMRYLAASRRWMAEYGLGDADVTGHSHYEIFPEISTAWRQVHRRGLAGEVVRAEEDRFERADGSVQWLRWEVLPWHEPGGFVGGILIFTEDITARKLAELALRESRSQLEAALGSMSDAVFISDAQGRFVQFNQAFATFHRFASKDECRRTWTEYPEFLELTRPSGEPVPVSQWSVPRALRGETGSGVEYALRRKDTGESWVGSFSFAPIRDEAGAIVGSVVTGREITEQKRAEDARREQQRLLVEMGAMARVAAWGYSPATAEYRATPELWRILERPAGDDFSLDSLAACCVGPSRHLYEQAVSDLVQHGRQFNLELQVRTDAGRAKWLQVIGTAVVARDEVVQLRGTIQDVTERKLAERSLRESEARYRDMFEASPHPMYVFDLDTLQFLDVNDSAIRQYGYTREEFLAMNALQIRPPEDAPHLREIIEHGSVGTIRTGPWRHRRRDGSELLVDITAHTLSFAGHRALVILASDITERVRTEQEIRALNLQLEQRVAERTAQLAQANVAKSEFLAGMSHELRTPLNAIIGFSEMLKDGVAGNLDERQRGFVADIFDAGTHLLSLINDILDLSKVEAGKLGLELGQEDAAGLLGATTLVVKQKALAHGIRLEVVIDPAVGRIRVDSRKVKQIVYNLLSNALKFTPPGGRITLGASRCGRNDIRADATRPARLLGAPASASEEFLAISVTDTGIGIDESQLAKLFEPFVQLHVTQLRPSSGTGLGLSLARRLAELHGGAMAVDSLPQQGSRFTVWLPYTCDAGRPGQ